MNSPELPVVSSEGQPEQPVFARPTRPFSVTLLALIVLIITGLNLARFILSLSNWEFLASQPGISPLYMALTGLIWTLMGSLLLWGLWRAKIWAPGLMQAMALTYALYYWLDHLFLVDHPVSGAGGSTRALLPLNWPFAAGVTVVVLAYVAWISRRHKVKAYFGQADPKPEQSQSDNDIPG